MHQRLTGNSVRRGWRVVLLAALLLNVCLCPVTVAAMAASGGAEHAMHGHQHHAGAPGSDCCTAAEQQDCCDHSAKLLSSAAAGAFAMAVGTAEFAPPAPTLQVAFSLPSNWNLPGSGPPIYLACCTFRE